MVKLKAQPLFKIRKNSMGLGHRRLRRPMRRDSSDSEAAAISTPVVGSGIASGSKWTTTLLPTFEIENAPPPSVMLVLFRSICDGVNTVQLRAAVAMTKM